MQDIKKLRAGLQYVAGSLKAPLADALRRDTTHLRCAAKEIARIAEVSERTAANYLAGAVEIPATTAAKLARVFASVRAVMVAAITPPEEHTLQSELVALKARLARLEARDNEDTHGPMVRPVDVAAAPTPRRMAHGPGRAVGQAED